MHEGIYKHFIENFITNKVLLKVFFFLLCLWVFYYVIIEESAIL